MSGKEEISHKTCQLTHIYPEESNYRGRSLLTACGSNFIWIWVDEYKCQTNFTKTFFQTHTKDGCWSRGPSARTSRRRFTRNWPQGAPKSFNLTAVDGCNATTAGCLRAKSPQNLWLEEKSQRDPWRIEHDRRQRCNVSRNSALLCPCNPFLDAHQW